MLNLTKRQGVEALLQWSLPSPAKRFKFPYMLTQLTFKAEKISFKWKWYAFLTYVRNIRSLRVSLKPNSKSCALKSRYDSMDVTAKSSGRVGKSANSMPAGLQIIINSNIIFSELIQKKFAKSSYPAMAAPIGIVSGVMDKLSGLAITVPSTNGANPGRNLFEGG